MMPKQTAQIIELIKEGKTCNQICEVMNLTNQQLWVRLTNIKNKGINFSREYFSDGNILYHMIYSIKALKEEKNIYANGIITKHNETEIKAIAISDEHLGSTLERKDLLDRVYNYCIKNNIHIIFNCGDIIDGTFGKYDKRIKDVYSQIEYLIKEYPFDKNILNFAVGGDHDYSALAKSYQDMTEIINNYRHDIVIPSYNNAVVNIKNDKILLYHHHENGVAFDSTRYYPLVLAGHTHKYTIKKEKSEKAIGITIPSLSDINESLPMALELTMIFDKGLIKSVIARQIYFADKDYILNETISNLCGRESGNSPIMYEKPYSFYKGESECKDITEDTTEKETKPLVKKLERPSQIDKFNQRYNLE